MVLLLDAIIGAAGLVVGYYVGTKYSTSSLAAELNTLLADGKADVANIKAWLASKL